MAPEDWLVGRNRRDEAADRIYAAAATLLARHGYDAFSIDALAAAVHCSPATIYRHTGARAPSATSCWPDKQNASSTRSARPSTG